MSQPHAGSVSILAIDGNKVSLVKTIDLVPAAALLSHVAVSPDGSDRRGDAQRRRQGRGRQARPRTRSPRRPRSTWRRGLRVSITP
jgi:hypothetical protein